MISQDMSNTTKSPLKVAREALTIGQDALPEFGHKYSPKRYTQAQLFAVLTLRHFFRTDYRGIVAILEDSSDLRRALGLKRIPHYTTLCQAARRFEKGGFGSFSSTQV